VHVVGDLLFLVLTAGAFGIGLAILKAVGRL
jgi:hypothetical protein